MQVCVRFNSCSIVCKCVFASILVLVHASDVFASILILVCASDVFASILVLLCASVCSLPFLVLVRASMCSLPIFFYCVQVSVRFHSSSSACKWF